MSDRSKLLALAEECDRAQEWMRQPDWAEDFSLANVVEFMNSRPTHLLPQVSAILRAQAEALS